EYPIRIKRDYLRPAGKNLPRSTYVRDGNTEGLAPARAKRRRVARIGFLHGPDETVHPVRIEFRVDVHLAAPVRVADALEHVRAPARAAGERDRCGQAMTQQADLGVEVGLREQLRHVRMTGHEDVVEALEEFLAGQAALEALLNIGKGV